MRTIALIGCSKRKMGGDCPDRKFMAGEIYLGNNYKKARDIGIDFFGCEKEFYILSAKYGLLKSSDEITYYDKYLGKCSASEKRGWADKVYDQLKQKFDLATTHFVLFAGSAYTKYIKERLNCTVLKFDRRSLTFHIAEEYTLEQLK